MPRIISNNLGKFLIAQFLILVLVSGFLFFKNLSANAQEQIKILPEFYSGDWQNPEAVFSQDLGFGAASGKFNQTNSAYLFSAYPSEAAAVSYTRTPAGAAEASPVAISVSVDSFSDFGFLEPPLTQAWNVIAEGDNNEVHGACLLFSELSYSESMTFPSDVYYRVFAQGYNSLENCQNNTASTGGYDLEGDGSEVIFEVLEGFEPIEEIIVPNENVTTTTATTTIDISTTTNATASPIQIFQEDLEGQATTTLEKNSSFLTNLWGRIKNLFNSEVKAESSVCKSGTNQPCGTEVGVCQIGVQICQEGVWGKCIGAVRPSDEICDGVDNNCDGQVDEGAICGEGGGLPSTCQQGSNRPCGTDVGACQIGVQVCQNDVWGKCIGAKTPSREICDQVDNNCDGQTDEGGVCLPGAVPLSAGEGRDGGVEKVLTLAGFGITPFENTKIKLVHLKLSLAGKGEAGDKLIIDYFSQNIWQNLAVFDLENEISNDLNGGYFLYGLPIFNSWQDLDNLKVRFLVEGFHPDVFLDAIWLEVEYETLPEIKTAIKREEPKTPKEERFSLKSAKKDWRSDESPEFAIEEASQGFWGKVASVFQKKETSAFLVGPAGDEAKASIQNDKVKIVPPAGKGFRPGLYKLKIIIREGGQEFIQEQDFTWGVLAINTSKSIYLPGENAYLQMAALTSDGHTICNADLSLEIISPDGSPTPVVVQKSGECGIDNVTSVPDYFAYYQVGGTGAYQMRLTNLGNGYEIADSFEVREAVPFDIERIGPTRIYPPSPYSVTLSIASHQEFNGFIEERVPAGFEISQPVYSKKYNSVTEEGDSKIIKWEVSLLAGEQIQLGYRFDAPDISPYLYLLGPLRLADARSGQAIFEEVRNWQVAADAMTTVLLNLTSDTTYTIPSNFSASNTIHAIGAGGGGRSHASAGAGGGGGGGYSATSSVELILPGATVGMAMDATNTAGTGGTPTYFCKDQVDCTAITGASVIVGANGGTGTTGTSGGAGGSTTGAKGGVTNAGGTGGIGYGAGDSGGGGGGAGGPYGNGGDGGNGYSFDLINSTGGGGGGDGGGAIGGNGVAGTSGVGGDSWHGGGDGGDSVTSGAGNPGATGGGGSGGFDAQSGGRGGNGDEWGTNIGSGGGGGGIGDSGANGGAGALYGGGGGGGSTGGSGAQGVIVIQYTPDAAPNIPTQDSPANASTSVSLTPTFKMTATDVDPDIPNSDLSYRVAIYSDSSCAVPVAGQFNDQAVSATGWQSTNSACVNTSGGTCYTSGTQGVFLTQTALSNSTTYYWKAAAQDPDYNKAFTTSSDPCYSFTTEGAANAAPSIDWTGMTGFHNGVTTITPEEWAEGDGVYIVTTTFAVLDTDGNADISTTTIFVYRSDVGIANCGWGTSTDLGHCYPTTSTDTGWNPTRGQGSSCDRSSVSGNYAYFWCTTTLSYAADATDVGSDFAASSWIVYASTSDLSWEQGTDTYTAATIDISTLRAVIVSPSTITYGTLLPDTNTNNSWVTTTATSTGNIAVDIHIDGGSLTHTNPAYNIPAYKQQFTTTSGLTYGASGPTAGLASLPTSTDATTDGKTHDVTMKKATTTVPGKAAADEIYWGIGVSDGQLTGIYSSTTNFVATSTIVNP